MNTENHNDRATGFWQKLYGLKNADNRGALTQLRYALEQDRYDLALPVIGGVLPERISKREIRLYAFVAGLFALYPVGENEARGLWTLGQSAYDLAKNLSSGKDSLDKRLTALLNADDDDIFSLIQQIIRQCSGKGISIHYPTLLGDLIAWHREDRRTQMKWATHYWVNPVSQEFDEGETGVLLLAGNTEKYPTSTSDDK